MTKTKFSDAAIERAIKAHPDAAMIYDTETTGLALRRGAGGYTAVIQKRIAGRLLKKALYPLAEAKLRGWDQVRRDALAIINGERTGDAGRSAAAAVTWQQAADAKALAKGSSTATQDADSFAIKTAKLGKVPVSSMTRAEAETLIADLSTRYSPKMKRTMSPATVGKISRSLAAIWSHWADTHEVEGRCPFRKYGSSKAFNVVRMDHLPPERFGEMVARLRTIGEADTTDGVRARAILVALTMGLRLNEVVQVPWSEIDGDVWTLPAERMKADAPLVRTLTTDAKRVMEQQRAIATGTSAFVFESLAKPETHIHNCDELLEQVCKEMEVDRLTMHDMRRTWTGFATVVAKIAKNVRAEMQGHQSGTGRDTQGRYELPVQSRTEADATVVIDQAIEAEVAKYQEAKR